MNRRGLLSLIGMGAATTAAAPAVVSAKAAAATLGLSLATNEPMGTACEPIGMESDYGSYWDHPARVSVDVRHHAREASLRGKLYPHMKSWGHGFRESVYAREEFAHRLFEQRIQNDRELRERVFGEIAKIGGFRK